MSLYNMLFGKSPNSQALLAVLGLSEDDFYRFRDCYLDEKGRIAIYTRGGGGNRECWCSEWGEVEEPVDFAEETHEKGCVVIVHHHNREHPCYLFDRDDDFDSTYATFYFRVPEEADRENLAEIQPEIGRDEAWVKFLSALKANTEEVES